MNELSLFSGTGGGLLGTKLLGFMPVGYVENNDYCQRILKQRITDGVLENAPIFGDIKAFISDGYADEYKGMVDIITAGFPCQPFSIAGKQQGDQDGRNMWPETIDVIRRVRWRTYQGCLITNMQDEFMETWPKAGMMQNGVCYLLPKLELHIREPAFSSFVPTPTSQPMGSNTSMRRHGTTAKERILNWPTPRAFMHKDSTTDRGKGNLGEVVGGPLNPEWVEWLMGWPIGWTDLRPLEMDKYRLWLKQFGSY